MPFNGRLSPAILAGLAVMLLLIGLNAGLYWDFYHPQECWDCGVDIGVPFAFWQSETFAGGNRILWPGLLGDLVVGGGLAVTAALFGKRFGRRRTPMSAPLPMRVLAVACILAATPLACVKYPWLPATAIEFTELQREPYPGGTESYHEDRDRRSSRVSVALLLYASGTVSLVGLFLVARGVTSRRAQTITWLITAATGAGIASFERSRIGFGTDVSYVAMAFHTPMGIAVVASLAALLTLFVSDGGRPDQ